MPNIFDPQWDEQRDKEGFSRVRAFVGRQAGAEKLGVSVWELGPGEASYPYHFHYAEEEALIVLSGRPSLRTPEGWRDLEPGELVVFPVGPGGAHQIVNRTDESLRILCLSANSDVEVVEYVDSGKTGAYANRGKPNARREIFMRDTAVDYWQGEEPPA
ncbi:MAG: cupin domain-containing protein [Actinobacteria bacterium]|nr:cupin domain-containing protein [Actinomycetota bacterium]